jgi:hypothetical protein
VQFLGASVMEIAALDPRILRRKVTNRRYAAPESLILVELQQQSRRAVTSRIALHCVRLFDRDRAETLGDCTSIAGTQ